MTPADLPRARALLEQLAASVHRADGSLLAALIADLEAYVWDLQRQEVSDE